MNDPNYIPYSKSVSEATRGADPYGSSNFIKETPLDAKSPVEMSKAKIGGDYVPVPVKSASVTGPTGVVETTYDHTNLSAKFKYPQISQDTVSQDTL